MAHIFREAMRAGAYGFSLSLIPRHIGYQGKPLASRLASKEELSALGRVMRELKAGVIELALVRQAGVLSDEDLDILLHLAQESQRPVTWLALIHMPNMPGTCEQMLARVQPFMEKGLSIPPQVNPRPVTQFYTLRNPFAFSEMPSWKGAFNRTVEEQVALYRSPQFREAFRDDIKAGRGLLFRGQWDRLHVTRVETEQNKQFLNQSVGEIAARLRKDPVDTLLDLAVEERAALGFTVSAAATTPAARPSSATSIRVLPSACKRSAASPSPSSGTPCSSSSRRVPISTRRPPTMARTPRPARFAKSSTARSFASPRRSTSSRTA
jgi:N-acyl-D-aspartate/D-glutamate deacylase